VAIDDREMKYQPAKQPAAPVGAVPKARLRHEAVGDRGATERESRHQES